MFTRELLLHLGIYGSTRVHQIDDLPDMRIALRLARAIDAYMTNWTMIEGDNSLYRLGNWKIVLDAFNTSAKPSESAHRLSITAIHQFQSTRGEFSAHTLVALLRLLKRNLHSAPETVTLVARISEEALGHNHPVSFICRTALLGQAFRIWQDIIFHYVYDWIGRLAADHGPDSNHALRYYDMDGPAMIHWMILDTISVDTPFSDPDLHASCLQQAIVQCSLVYRDDGFWLNSLREFQATLAQRSGNIEDTMRFNKEIYDKLNQISSHSRSLIANAAYRFAGIHRDKGREDEARTFYVKAIELYLSCPNRYHDYFMKALTELHDLMSFHGADTLGELMAIYAQYWALDECGQIVLRDPSAFDVSSDDDSMSDIRSDRESESDASDDSSQLDSEGYLNDLDDVDYDADLSD